MIYSLEVGGVSGEKKQSSRSILKRPLSGQVAGMVSMVTGTHPATKPQPPLVQRNWFDDFTQAVESATQSCVSSGHCLKKNTFYFSRSLLMIILSCLRNVLLSDMLGEWVLFEIFRLLHSFQIWLMWKSWEGGKFPLLILKSVSLTVFLYVNLWCAIFSLTSNSSFEVRWWFWFNSRPTPSYFYNLKQVNKSPRVSVFLSILWDMIPELAS